MGKKIYDINYAIHTANQRGWICLSDSYKSVVKKLDWKCDKGHLFSMPLSSVITKGYGCPICNNQKKIIHTTDSIKKMAVERGWEFLTEIYNGGTNKYNFKCEKGHLIQKTGENFIRGSKCRSCAGKELLTISDFQKIAKERGGSCLSTEYYGPTEKLKFKCANGHVFIADGGSLKNRGSWCKKCTGLDKGTIEGMVKLAKTKGGECLSKFYTNSTTKLQWKCKDNHIWWANPGDVKFKSWCPYCTWNKQEEKCRHILNKILNTTFLKSRKILDCGFELDGYSKELNIAFEYNGEQHYIQTHFFHKTYEKFAEAEKRDVIKQKECEQKGIKLIIISYEKSESDNVLYEYLKTELKKKKISFSDLNLNEVLKDFYASSSKLEEVKTIINQNKGELLSNEYVDFRTKLTVKCPKNHIWHPSVQSIKRGTWCPECYGKIKRGIEEMQEIAKAKNGLCLSDKYIDSKTPLIWQCEKGHTWSALASAVKRSKKKEGTWCPECFGKKTGTIEEMRLFASKRGHTCLSKIYVNRDKKVKWKCDKNHIWESSYQSYKNSKNGCPYCTGKLT
jgi:hypothetical protein